jgi:hypothetical protein
MQGRFVSIFGNQGIVHILFIMKVDIIIMSFH